MTAPQEILDLVERFGRNAVQYKTAGYNETQLRREFVDPFFAALGWDIDNTQGWAEPYKEVIHEDAIRVSGTTKAPDYAFRIGGTRKFFVETKWPGIDLKENPAPALQLRRYAWSAKLPLSVLTDFEEFAVYDTRVRPAESDRASTARVRYLAYRDYPDRWDSIASVFSKEAILKGSFDRYAESAKAKRGTAKVDDAFLADMERWRSELARKVALRNPELSGRELNLSVQRILDRVIFLRIAEDRGLEEYGRLRQLAEEKKDLYSKLQTLFERADERYNSGLFHFREEKDRDVPPDTLTPKLNVDDVLLRRLILELYYPKSPYEFAVIPASILGQVYERFLGRVIRLTPSHRAVVEEKPEVRKQGGVYYTPENIVEEIVREAVSPTFESYKPGPRGGASRIRVVDPACGSGSFLLTAYQFILDWHLQRYLEDGPKKHATRLFRTSAEDWRLTTEERKRILLNSIYGVDIDPQAVQVTKLSLLLKVLEGETEETIDRQIALFHERALPDLSKNIRCGNTLITPEFFDQVDFESIDVEDRLEINAFEWRKAFPEIMDAGGFHAVIGNPPYVLLQSLDRPDIFEYLGRRYRSATYKIDTYHLFVEAGMNLLREGGRLGYIIPVSFLRNKHAKALRQEILDRSEVELIHIFDSPVFQGPSVDTAIMVLRATMEPDDSASVRFLRSASRNRVIALGEKRMGEWRDHPDKEFDPPSTDLEAQLAQRMEQAGELLGKYADAYFGIQTRDRDKHVWDRPREDSARPAIDGRHIEPFLLHEPEEFVDFRPEAIKSGGKEHVYQQRRIVVRQIGRTPIATIAPAGVYSLNTIYNVFFTRSAPVTLEVVLGAFLTKTGRWYWDLRFFDQKRTFPKVKKKALLSFPLPPASNKTETIHQCVRRLLKLNQELQEAELRSSREEITRQISHEQDKLDAIFFDIYSLTEEEIAAIERRVKRIQES